MTAPREPVQGGDQNGTFTVPHPICQGCHKAPDEMEEYRDMGKEHRMSPAAFVVMFDGTCNRQNGHFLCTPCYIEAGSPTSRRGWVCP